MERRRPRRRRRARPSPPSPSLEAAAGRGGDQLGGDGIGSGKMGLGLDLSKVASAYENGDIEPNELTNKATKLRYFSTKCSMVTPSLFLGADPVARDKAVLESNGVTHVLNAAGTACQNYHEGSFAYKTLHLYDTPREDISPVMYGAIDFIDAAIEGGGKVFVHCHQGVSRSSSMVIAYLMWKEGLSFDAAYTKTKEARGVCNPNAGFICASSFGKDIAGGEPPSPPRLYRMCPFVGGPVARGVEARAARRSRSACSTRAPRSCSTARPATSSTAATSATPTTPPARATGRRRSYASSRPMRPSSSTTPAPKRAAAAAARRRARSGGCSAAVTRPASRPATPSTTGTMG